jgi:polyketide cyclase/dehydrase/lipid transport protein
MLATVRSLLIVALLLHGAANATERPEPAWRTVEVAGGVEVLAADGPDGLWGGARGRIEAPPHAVLDLLCDFEALPKMQSRLDRVQVLERDDAGALVYFHYHLPWPLADRSYTAAHRWWTEPSGTIVFEVRGANDRTPDDGAIHVTGLFQRIVLGPAGGGNATDVDFVFRGDFAGMLPHGVRAQTAWKVPMNAFLAMRRLLEPRYALR